MIMPGWKHVRFAWRRLRRRPAFAFTATVTASLAIGALVLTLTVADTIRRWAVPLPRPDELVWIGDINGTVEDGVSFPELARWRGNNHSFVAISALTTRGMTYVDGPDVERIPSADVSAQFFKVVGVPLRIGKGFSGIEDLPDGPRAVVVSDKFWTVSLRSRSDVVGTRISLDGQARTIVGVMPPGFAYPDNKTQLWVSAIQEMQPFALTEGVHIVQGIARLRPGVSVGRAFSDLQQISSGFGREENGSRATARPIVRLLEDQNTRDIVPRVRVLIAAALAILLLGCANVTNMFLTQTLSRQGELTIRRALGAKGREILSLLFVETLVVVSGGAVGGLFFATILTSVTARHSGLILPDTSYAVEIARVLAVAIAVAIFMGAGLSVLSYRQAQNGRLSDALKGVALGRSSRTGRRVRTLLIAIQVAFSLVLLLAAGILAMTYRHLSAVDLGLEAKDVYSARVARPIVVFTREQRTRSEAFMSTLVSDLNTAGGIRSVSLTTQAPGSGNEMTSMMTNSSATDSAKVGIAAVTDNFFRTLRIPIRDGRAFLSSDNQPSQLVAIIDANLAKSLFGTRSAIGQTISIRDLAIQPTVIGVVGAVRQGGPMRVGLPQVYLRYGALPMPWVTVLFQSSLPPAAAQTVLRDVIRRIDPNQPVEGFGRLPDLLRDRLDRSRFYATLLVAFAMSSILLTAIGLYGAISLTVAQRTFEIGVRVAIGATPGQIFALIMREAGVAIGCGIIIGLCLTIVCARILKSMLFGISPADPSVVFGAVVVVGFCGTVAAMIPAIRAAQIAPVIALRVE